jgi:hypothetical protein
VVLLNGPKAVGTFALVDSGADSCVFPASLAAPLGIALPNQRSCVFCGIGADAQVAFYEKIEMGLWDTAAKKMGYRFAVYAGFCPSMEHVGMGLLGQDGFFSQFKVIVDYRAGCFDIEP